jgi:hypothetical protein
VKAGKSFAHGEFSRRTRGNPEEKVGADSDAEILTSSSNLMNWTSNMCREAFPGILDQRQERGEGFLGVSDQSSNEKESQEVNRGDLGNCSCHICRLWQTNTCYWL